MDDASINWQRAIRMYVCALHSIRLHMMHAFTIIDPEYRNYEAEISLFMRVCSKQLASQVVRYYGVV